MPYTNNPDEYYIGKGRVWIDVLDADGARTGERYLGNTPSFELTPTSEKLDHFSAATAEAELDSSIVTRSQTSIRIVADEFSKENLAIAFMGDNSSLTQTADSVEAEAISGVVQDRWYELAYRQVSNVVVTGPSGTPTYDLTDDYLVDAETGRIYIVAGGGITDDSDLEVDYDYDDLALQTTRAITNTTLRAFIRFISDPAEGRKREFQIWKATLRADGAIGLITEEWGQISLLGEVESDAANHPNEPHMRIIDLE